MARARRPETLASTLGRRVREFRQARGWSQERLAEQAEMDRSYIAGIELGGRNPSLKALERLARALKISVRDLFPPQ